MTLVKRMLDGDEAAMELFGDTYFPALYRFARARLASDPELAREIVQTTVVKALGKLASYRGEASLFTWLCACCRNEIAQHFRRTRRSPIVELVDDEVAVPVESPSRSELSPEGATLKREKSHLVHVALDLLPPHYARALEWKYLEQASVQEIAARLRLGAKAAESLLTRARSAFRNEYERLSATGTRQELAYVEARGRLPS